MSQMTEMSKILCCICGVPITPNDAAMCMDCLKNEIDLTSDYEKTIEIVQCKKCDRWNVSKDHWTHHEIESASLLAVCLRKIHGLNDHNTKVIEAKWIWTEPHSKRIKVQVVVERSVMDDKARIQQKFVVEYIVKNKQCLDCIREATDHTWGCCIQLRQRHTNKSSLCAIESIILKSGLQNSILNINIIRDGIDLFFRNRAQADKIVELISSNIPTKFKISKKLISKDKHTNESRYEHSIYLEVAPFSRGDLILTHKDLWLVHKISSCVHLISPVTGKTMEITSVKYFSKPELYPVVLTLSQLTSFVVLDISDTFTSYTSSSLPSSSWQQKQFQKNTTTITQQSIKNKSSSHPFESFDKTSSSSVTSLNEITLDQININDNFFSTHSETIFQLNNNNHHSTLQSNNKQIHNQQLNSSSSVTGSVIPITGSVIPVTGSVIPITGSVIPVTGSVIPLSEAIICRENDMGQNDISFTVTTHLGHILKSGDQVLGYDLSQLIIDDDLLEQLHFEKPDAILVRKSYAEKRKQNKLSKNKQQRNRNTNKTIQKIENNNKMSIFNQLSVQQYDDKNDKDNDQIDEDFLSYQNIDHNLLFSDIENNRLFTNDIPPIAMEIYRDQIEDELYAAIESESYENKTINNTDKMNFKNMINNNNSNNEVVEAEEEDDMVKKE